MAATAESKSEKENISTASDAEKINENKEEGKGTSLSANLRKSKCKNMTMVEEFCVFCYGTLFSNDEGDIEELLRCSECLKFAHPSCLEIPDIAVENTKLYNWQCNDCKGCFACKKKNKEKSMILCDFCDRGFHTFCLEKKPSRPSKGSWKCPVCKNMESANKNMESASESSELSSPTKSFQAENDGNDEMKGEANTNLSTVDAGIDGEEISSKSVQTISSILNVTASSKKEVTDAEDGTTKIDLDVNFKTVKDSKCRENDDCFLLQDTSQLLVNSGGKTEDVGDERIAPNALGPLGNLAEITEAKKEKVMLLRKSIGTEENQLKKSQNDNMPNCDVESSKGKPGRSHKKIIKLESERGARKVSKRLSGIPVPMIKESINPIKLDRSDKINKPVSDKKLKRKNSDVKTIESGTEKRNDSQEKIPGPVLNSKIEKIPDSEKALDQVSEMLGIDKSQDAPILSEFIEKTEINDNAQENSGLKPEDLKLAEVDSTSAGNANSSDDKLGNESKGEIVVKRKRGRPRKRRPGEHPNIEKQKLSESPNKKPADDDDKQKSRFSIILRRTPREPEITPTTSKNISSAQAVRKVYPTRDRETPHSSSPPSALSSPRMSPLKASPSKNAKSHLKAAKTPPKTPLRTSPRPQKTPKRIESPKTPKSDQKGGRKGDKLSTPKRKLPFAGKQDESKRLKVQSPDKSGSGSKKSIVNDNTAINTRRRSRKGKNYESPTDNNANGSQKSSDQLDGFIDNIVSHADIALFEQAQLAVKRDFATEEENSLEQGIKKVDFGDYEIDAWYSSPYPSEYKILGKVYICEYCLKYMKSATILRRHMAKCLWRHPPGDEIYRKDSTSVFEVDGEKSPAYCQNLCLLAKLFLDHKTLYYEVEPFLFYVMTAADSSGCHIVGYFSKEKVSFLNYNVSCILVLPHYMRKGYGNVLIDFSYLLSRAAGKIGSPERPLSDLGLISYRSYWKHVLLRYLCSYNEDFVSIKEMSQKTAVLSNDLISTMQALGILKYWKGQHVISLQEDMLDTYMAKLKSRTKLKLEIDEACLRWTLKDYGQSKAKPRHA